MERFDYPGGLDEALSSSRGGTRIGMAIVDAGQAGAREKAAKKKKMAAAADAAREGKDGGGGGEADGGGGGTAYVGRISLVDGDDGDDDATAAGAATTLSLALLNGPGLLGDLGSLGRLRILRSGDGGGGDPPRGGGGESSRVCNKKKCEITIKFCVYPPTPGGGEGGSLFARVVPTAAGGGGGGDDGDGDDGLAMLVSDGVRVPEGTLFRERRRLAMTRREERGKKRREEELDERMARASVGDAATAASAAAAGGGAAEGEDDDMVVTAWEVSGSIDYTKLIERFGSRPLTPHLLRRLENVTVKRGTVPRLHRFLRRGIFFSHRDLERICELLEGWYGVDPPPPPEGGEEGGGECEDDGVATPPVEYIPPPSPCPIYLYTGRGPSSAAMHLGHLVPFLFTAWLQKAFRCPLVVQMTDDEKFLFKGEYNGPDGGEGGTTTTGDGGDGGGDDDDRTGDNLDHFAALTIENAKDIIACDFDYDRTFLFSDLEYVGRMYPNVVRIWKAVTVNQVNGIFGFDGTANIGKAAFPAVQAAPSFGSSFPIVLGGGSTNASTLACLIPCAIDQDPYFRMTRDVAHKLVPRRHPLGGKPALIHSKFFPPLQGAKGKMSSSDPNSAIFLTDAESEIERKIKVHAYSGGRETKELQMRHGANLDVDVSYQWLRFFMEDDDELERIGREYETGSGEFWSTGAVKAKLVVVLKELVGEHKERRTRVTDEVVRQWMTERCIA